MDILIGLQHTEPALICFEGLPLGPELSWYLQPIASKKGKTIIRVYIIMQDINGLSPQKENFAK